jgi:hypothetical protein
MLETYEVEELKTLAGHEVVDAEGRTVGYIDLVFRDEATGRPQWLGIWDGLPDGKPRTLVPLKGAEVIDDAVRLPWDAETIRSAPSYEQHGDVVIGDDEAIEISPETEQAAYEIYGITPDAPRGETQAIRYQTVRIYTGAPERRL